ncbi:MAG: hypothetical protein GY906_24650 [bacterium]|nr:hypothetical protein [bacterium]
MRFVDEVDRVLGWADGRFARVLESEAETCLNLDNLIFGERYVVWPDERWWPNIEELDRKDA